MTERPDKDADLISAAQWLCQFKEALLKLVEASDEATAAVKNFIRAVEEYQE